ncbi:hypothetical protein H0H93_009120 [Arthromyces matolae]|nr:hypothetical protein H0H93_009120 [Arthromyces matolae]
MRTRRVLSHFTVAFLFVGLVGLHVTSAYPINDHSLVLRLQAKEASPGPRTTATSSARPESPNCYVDAEGTPLGFQPKWINFKIGDPPELKPSNNHHTLPVRAQRVERINNWRTELKEWSQNNLPASQILVAQKEIVDELEGVTRYDLEDAAPSGLERYKAVILNRMLTMLQMHKTSLSCGFMEKNLQRHIEIRLGDFDCLLGEFYGQDSGYGDLLDNLESLTKKVKSDLEKEKNKGTADIHTHS